MRIPTNVSPLAFLEYNEEKIFDTIMKLGREKPEDTDTNFTNCLLNSYANMIHKKRYNFHPYTFELAKLLREGCLDRAEALSKLEAVENPLIIQYVEKRLIG